MTQRGTSAYLVPVFNDVEGLTLSLKSLSKDDLVIIVDDGSVPEVRISNDDFSELRIEILRLSKNSGIVTAMNEGLKLAKSLGVRYVARLDAGDQASVARLSVQEAMCEHNGYDLVAGPALIKCSANSQYLDDRVGGKPLTRIICFRNPFVHSAVMYSVDAVLGCGGYSDQYPAAEDFNLWSKLIRKNPLRVGYTPDFVPCIKYVSASSISSKRRKVQALSRRRICVENGMLESAQGVMMFVYLSFLAVVPYRAAFMIKGIFRGE